MNDPTATPIPASAAPASPVVQSACPIDNALDAAKAIVASLKALDKTQQERAIRYASETLELASTPVAARTPTPMVDLMPIGSGATAAAKRPVDIKQFTESKAPKSDNQFAAVVAYYYRFEAPPEQRRDTINDAVLREAVRMVVRKRPSRMVLHNAKNRGYLDAIGGGEFRINTVGENLVAVTLPNNGEAPRKKVAKKSPKAKAKPKAK